MTVAVRIRVHAAGGYSGRMVRFASHEAVRAHLRSQGARYRPPRPGYRGGEYAGWWTGPGEGVQYLYPYFK